MAILITDGREQDTTLESQAALAKANNITIFTIGIGNEDKINYKQLERVATPPHEFHSFKANDFSKLLYNIGNFSWVPMICVKKDHCQEHNCHHICLNNEDESGYNCACRSGYDLTRDKRWCVFSGVNLPKVTLIETGFTQMKFKLDFQSDKAFEYVDHLELSILSNGKSFNKIIPKLSIQNKNFTFNELPHDSEWSAIIMVLDENGNSLTDNVHFNGKTKNPTLSLAAGDVKHNQVQLSWSSNHLNIPSEKTIRWFLYETNAEQGMYTIPADARSNTQIIASLRPATPYYFVLEEKLNNLTASANLTVTTRKPELEIQPIFVGMTSATIKWNRKEYTQGAKGSGVYLFWNLEKSSLLKKQHSTGDMKVNEAQVQISGLVPNSTYLLR